MHGSVIRHPRPPSPPNTTTSLTSNTSHPPIQHTLTSRHDHASDNGNTGGFFLLFGLILLFDRALLAMGDILFLIGITLLLGPQRTFVFFARKQKWRGIYTPSSLKLLPPLITLANRLPSLLARHNPHSPPLALHRLLRSTIRNVHPLRRIL